VEKLRPPHLHDRLSCVRAPTAWLSTWDGQLRDGADGLYVADRRVLTHFELRVNGEAPVPLRATETGPETAEFVGYCHAPGDPSVDPTIWCERRRQALPDGGRESIRLTNASRESFVADVVLAVSTDLALMTDVKWGVHPHRIEPRKIPSGVEWRGADGLAVRLLASVRPQQEAGHEDLQWHVVVPPGSDWSVEVTITCVPARAEGFRLMPASAAPAWEGSPLSVTADDARLTRLVEVGRADLSALLLSDPLSPGDLYPAAGSPWYLTMFARDALWTAMLAMPLGPELAGATLRSLARRQGTRIDPATEEQPGKIPHELRPTDVARWLPPIYYGTVDATPLFVITLVEAWRWGLAHDQVRELIPAAEKALRWMEAFGDQDGDGFIEYLPSGSGLANQGWKDSTDAIQYADGRLANAPIALVEVQAYAHRAATEGADLLDAFGRPGADGQYPAIALEAAKKPVDGLSSNIAHLLGSGLLTGAEEALIARRLAEPSLNSGYGLRTLADTARGFNPLSYHAGSVWPHDTAIAILGLCRTRHPDAASVLLEGLLAAAPAFGFRLPELYGGHPAVPLLQPTPYPGACRPQAWAAAVGPACVRALLGLAVDVPAGQVILSPMSPSPLGAYTVRNIRLGTAGTLDVQVDAHGEVIDYESTGRVAIEYRRPDPAGSARAHPEHGVAPRPRGAFAEEPPRVS
jgi:glycogen debranching enzyme